MNTSNYVAEIQSTCIPNEQLVAGQHVGYPSTYNVSGYKLLVRDTCMLPVDMLPWCKRGFVISSAVTTSNT